MFWLVLQFLLQAGKTQHEGPWKTPAVPDSGVPHVLQAQQAGLSGQGAETRAARDKKIPGVLA